MLSAQGWLMGPFTNDQLLRSMSAADVWLIDWGLIRASAISLASVMLISLAALLLNISGIELAVGKDIDLNRELRTVGLGNVLAGSLGGAVTYPSISTTTLNHKISGGSRLVPLVAAGIFVAAIVVWRGAVVVCSKTDDWRAVDHLWPVIPV